MIYPGAYIQWLISRGAYIWRNISGALYSLAYIRGTYIWGLIPGAYIERTYFRATYIRGLQSSCLYPRANIRGPISGWLYPGIVSGGSWGLISGGIYPGPFIQWLISDSEQVNKRLSPPNSKELYSRFTCPCKRQLIRDSICARSNSC